MQKRNCPECNKPLTWIPQYQRWYCKKEKIYPVLPLCPLCQQPLNWIPQYKRWYCYNDTIYPSLELSNSPPPPPPYELKIDDHEFEEARRCLINSYDSYIQNHAGLLIAVIIGGLALISQWNNFIVNGYGVLVFTGLLFLVGFGFLYLGSRIAYWTKYGDVALTVSQTGVYDTWSKRNVKDKDGKPSFITMIHYAAHDIVFRAVHGEGIKFGNIDNILVKFAIWVSRSTYSYEEDKSQSK